MTDRSYPLLVSLLTHTQRLLQAHTKLLVLATDSKGLSDAEVAEHEQVLREVKGVVEAQQRWIAEAEGRAQGSGSDPVVN